MKSQHRYTTASDNGLSGTQYLLPATMAALCIAGALGMGISSAFASTPSSGAGSQTGRASSGPGLSPDPGPVFVGHISWQGRPTQPSYLLQVPVSLTLRAQAGGATSQYAGMSTDISGFFTVPVSSLSGAYDWWVKSAQAGGGPTDYNPGWLAVSGTVTLSGAPVTNVEMGLQKAGDANNDNVVSAPDFTLLKVAFGKVAGQPGFDRRADFNGDGAVSASDFTLLKVNFGAGGAPQFQTGPCQLFPSDNYWHKDISSAPVHALSDQYINALGSTYFLHPGFAAGTWYGESIGLKITHNYQPTPVAINFTQYGGQSDRGPYPVPTDAAIQGGPNGTGDRHVTVVDEVNCMEYDLYKAYPHADGSWEGGSGAKWNLTSNALRPYGWTSTDAAGFPLAQALVQYQEVANGAINHALRFTAMNIHVSNIVWPARHTDGQSTDPYAPPMGSRLRLKASVPISSYSPAVRTILTALKQYGMVLADSSSGDQVDIDGEPDSRWNDADLVSSLERFHASDFEVVDMSGYMIDSNSAATR